MPLLILFSALSAALFAAPGAASGAESPPHPVQDDPSPAEREWAEIRGKVTARLVHYRQLSETERETVSFQAELSSIGNFVRKYARSEPDFAFAARIFMAREVLANTLGKKREALQILQAVIAEAPDALVAGMAALHAAKLAVETGTGSQGVRLIREAYAARKVKDLQFLDALKTLEAQASVVVGQPFPPLEFEDLEGKTRRLEEWRGKVVYLVVFKMEHPASSDRVQEAVGIHQSLEAEGVRVVGISLDSNREQLVAALEKTKVGFPVGFDGKEWESPAAKLLGISTLPATFIIDTEGKLEERDLPKVGTNELLRIALRRARERGTLRTGPGR